MDKLPDLLALIPDGRPKQVIEYCLGPMGLSTGDAEEVVDDACDLLKAINRLLQGGVMNAYRDGRLPSEDDLLSGGFGTAGSMSDT